MSKSYGIRFVEILKGMTYRERLLALVRVLKVIHNRKIRGKNGSNRQKQRKGISV